MKTPRKSSSLTKDDLTVDNDSVKRDLLSLGIDLDESLIDRMRRNLGISTSFEAVARASTIVRSRNSQVIGSAPDVILRSVEKEETEKVSPRSAQPSLIQVDQHRVMALLHDLNSQQSTIGPSIRQSVSKLLPSLSLAYSRHPDVFVRRLLNAPKDKKEAPERLLLKHRFMDEKDFVIALKRISRSFETQPATDLFYFVEEQKLFAGNLLNVVDLWQFIGLLQAGDPLRRSFDQTTSKTSCDVEFWNQLRAPDPNGKTNSPVKTLSPSGRFTSKGSISSSQCWEKTRDLSRMNNDYSAALEKNQSGFQQRLASENVAKLLGGEMHMHTGVAAKGRNTVGSLRIETREDATPVAAALHSPARSASRQQQQQQDYRSWSEYARSLNSTQENNSKSNSKGNYSTSLQMLEGSAVAAAMGRPHSAPRLRISTTSSDIGPAPIHTSDDRASGDRFRPKNSFAALKNEWKSNSSVADALGSSRSQPLSEISSPRKSSVGRIASENRCDGMKSLLKDK